MDFGSKDNDYHLFRIKVQEHHLDVFGHMNNATFMKILEEARWALISSRGYDIEKVLAEGKGPIILEAQLRYVRELRLHDRVLVKTRFDVRAKRISLIHQIMLREPSLAQEKAEIACEARFKSALFDLKTRKIIFPSDAWLKVLGQS